MSMTSIFKHIVDGLWAAGGIGAAADLGLEDFAPRPLRPCPALPAGPAGVRGSRRLPRSEATPQPLEGELCWNPCARRSVR